jgi:hypothetical protein
LVGWRLLYPTYGRDGKGETAVMCFGHGFYDYVIDVDSGGDTDTDTYPLHYRRILGRRDAGDRAGAHAGA